MFVEKRFSWMPILYALPIININYVLGITIRHSILLTLRPMLTKLTAIATTRLTASEFLFEFYIRVSENFANFTYHIIIKNDQDEKKIAVYTPIWHTARLMTPFSIQQTSG